MRDEDVCVVHIKDKYEIKKAIMNIIDILDDLTDRVDINKFTEKIVNLAESFEIVDKKGRMIAYAAMYVNDTDNKMAYITLIGCEKRYQRRGYGTMLFEYLESYAQNSGMKSLRLEVKKDNVGAICFYKKHGMKILEGTIYGFYMQKDLT